MLPLEPFFFPQDAWVGKERAHLCLLQAQKVQRQPQPSQAHPFPRRKETAPPVCSQIPTVPAAVPRCPRQAKKFQPQPQPSQAHPFPRRKETAPPVCSQIPTFQVEVHVGPLVPFPSPSIPALQSSLKIGRAHV